MKKELAPMRQRLFLSVCGLVLILLPLSFSPAQAVAQWARMYGMSCEGCHSSYPRLNAVGIAFKQNGYRFTPGEETRLSLRSLAGYIGPTSTPSLGFGQGERGTAFANSAKIHIGGPIGRSFGFLIQPITGSTADFNMVQGMVAGGSGRNQFRLVGGRLYAWANGGGIGGSDRYPTATAPRLLGTLHGVTAGGLGNGARLEYTRDSMTTLAVFTSDMEAAETHTPVFGASLTRLLDKTASAVELYMAQGAVPVAGQSAVSAWRYGLFVNRVFADKKGQERYNLLTGILSGSDARTIKAGLPTNFWSGFMELDWSPSNAFTGLVRQEWENGAVAQGNNSALTLGAATRLMKNLRLDTDLLVHSPGVSSPRFLFRLRLVY